MCQLIFVNSNIRDFNRIALLSLLREDSETRNKDGCGYFTTDGGLLKSQACPLNIQNLGGNIKENIKSNSPILAHVRQAASLNGNKKIEKEKSHPFESEHYIFAHNGTLEFKDPKLEENYKTKDLIDSQIFLEELEKRYTGNIEKDLGETMSLFRGKFAFLIFDKKLNKFYIARGYTATLFISRILGKDNKVIGFIVNTEKLDLVGAIEKSIAYYQLTSGLTVNYTEPEELKKETIFEVNKTDIFEIGKIIENARAYTPAIVNRNYGGVHDDSFFTGNTTVNKREKKSNIFEKISNWLTKNQISIEDFDQILYAVLGKGILSLETADLDSVEELFNILERRTTFAKMTKIWEKIKYKSPYNDNDDLQFPYFLNSFSKFKGIARS